MSVDRYYLYIIDRVCVVPSQNAEDRPEGPLWGPLGPSASQRLAPLACPMGPETSCQLEKRGVVLEKSRNSSEKFVLQASFIKMLEEV